MRILPLLGLGDLRFGANREDVRHHLGEPEQTALDDEGTEDASEAWYYWARGVSVHFGADVDWRLDCIEASSPSAELRGVRLVGATEPELREFLGPVQAQWPTEEMKPIEVPEWDLNFWTECGVVESIQWGVPIGDDDREIWPK